MFVSVLYVHFFNTYINECFTRLKILFQYIKKFSNYACILLVQNKKKVYQSGCDQNSNICNLFFSVCE